MHQSADVPHAGHDICRVCADIISTAAVVPDVSSKLFMLGALLSDPAAGRSMGVESHQQQS